MRSSSAALALARYIDDPVAFVRELLHADPDPVQETVLRAVATNQAVAVKSGHGVGKTALDSWTIIWFLVTRPFARIPVTAPTMHQLDDILWPEVAKWIEGSAVKGLLDWHKQRLSVRGYEDTWFAVPRTASVPENLQGFHADHVLFVVDEASGMKQVIMEVVEGAMTNEGARLLMTGNPTQITGTFHSAFHRDRELFKPFTISSEGAPRVSRTYIERMAKKYGKDSDVYRVRVLGEFPRGAADDFIPLSIAEAAIGRDVPHLFSRPWSIGVDPARFGDDESVVALLNDDVHLLPLRAFSGMDGPRLAGQVVLAIKDIRTLGYSGKIPVRVDETGVGASCYDQLALQESVLNIDLQGVNFGGQGDDEHDDTAALIWGQLKAGLPAMHLPDDDDLVAQLSCRKYHIQPNGKIKLERKEDMKKRGIASPDRADAVALAKGKPPIRSVAKSLW